MVRMEWILVSVVVWVEVLYVLIVIGFLMLNGICVLLCVGFVIVSIYIFM